MDDFLDLADELIIAGSSASPDLWDRFAEAVDMQHRQQDDPDGYDPREGMGRGEVLDTYNGRITELCQ